MSNNFWNQGFNAGDNEPISEFDLIQEEQEMLDLSSEPVMMDATEEELQQVQQQSSYDLNDNEANVIYNAKLRLEQAKLYEMLINHNIFEGVNASPEAVSVVENELKLYIVRRLEILLGIRKPVQNEQQPQQSDFNSVEVGFLKQLAYKGTLGQSAVSGEEVNTPRPKPISGQTQQTGLNPIGKRQVQAPARPATQPKSQAKPKRNNPAPRKPKQKIAPSGNGRNLTQQEAMEIAKRDLEETKNRKDWNKMSAKEKKARIKEVNEKHKKPRPEGALPMPSPAQLEQHYMMRQQMNTASSNQTQQFNTILANVLMNKKD